MGNLIPKHISADSPLDIDQTSNLKLQTSNFKPTLDRAKKGPSVETEGLNDCLPYEKYLANIF